MQVNTNSVKRSGGNVTCQNSPSASSGRWRRDRTAGAAIAAMLASRKKATSGAVFQALPTARTSTMTLAAHQVDRPAEAEPVGEDGADPGLAARQIREDDPGAVGGYRPGRDHDRPEPLAPPRRRVQASAPAQGPPAASARPNSAVKRSETISRVPERRIVQHRRVVLHTDEIGAVAAEEADLVEAHPERVAERIGDDQQQERQDRQRDQDRRTGSRIAPLAGPRRSASANGGTLPGMPALRL